MRFVPVVLAAALAVLAGCHEDKTTGKTGSDGGTKSDGGTDGGTACTPPATGAQYPAPHQDPPQVQAAGGPVLTSPKVVPVFFANDDSTSVAELTDFLSTIGSTKYWNGAVFEYGVGALTSVTPFMSSESATGTWSDQDIQSWITTEIGSDSGFPAPDENTIYAMNFPAATTITLGGGRGGSETSCQAFGGYHSEVEYATNQYVAYAVVPRCAGFAGLDGINGTTAAESHELAEASTDPYPDNNPAYVQVDNEHLYWELAVGGGELGDMCAQNPGAFYTPDGFKYAVQRIWSNESALAGHDPCQPELDCEAYFNAAPELNDMTTLSLEGQSVQMLSVNVAIGQTTTIPIDLFSDADTGGPWTVSVADAQQLEGGSATVTYSLDKTTGSNGDQVNLTITPMSMPRFGASLFFVFSQRNPPNGPVNFWIGEVGQ